MAEIEDFERVFLQTHASSLVLEGRLKKRYILRKTGRQENPLRWDFVCTLRNILQDLLDAYPPEVKLPLHVNPVPE